MHEWNQPHTLIIISPDSTSHNVEDMGEMNSARTLLAACILIAFATGACSKQSNTTPLPYTADFKNTASGWQTLSDTSADVKYDAGALRFVIKQENLSQWSVPGKTFADATLDVDAQPNSGPTDNGFGVIFRVQNRRNFYHFEISSDGYWRAGIMKDGVWTNWDDWAQNSAIKTGNAMNHIRIIMVKDKFQYFVNDQLILQRQEKTFATGDIGLLALTLLDRPGTDVSFTHVSVTAPPSDSQQ